MHISISKHNWGGVHNSHLGVKSVTFRFHIVDLRGVTLILILACITHDHDGISYITTYILSYSLFFFLKICGADCLDNANKDLWPGHLQIICNNGNRTAHVCPQYVAICWLL